MSIIEELTDLVRRSKVIDLSHPLEEGMTAAPGHNYFYHMLWNSYDLGEAATSYQCILNEHTGTHVDAPAHFMDKKSGKQIWIDQIPAKSFMVPCMVIKAEGLAGGDTIGLEDVQREETEQGAIKKGSGVLFYTGWERYWDKRPKDERFKASWPGLSGAAAKYLAAKGVALIGTDALSIDSSGAEDFPAHIELLGNGIPVFENLRNLDKIGGRCFLMALPLLIHEGTASPVRVVAFVG